MNIALIAHDRMKDRMVALAREFAALLRQHTLMATGTTGGRLQADTGLVVERLLSGPLGGDLQIGARLSMGEVDAVVFLRDPMTAQPHEPDISGLTKAAALGGQAFGIAVGQIDIGKVTSDMTAAMAKGVPQPDGSLKPEPCMDMSAVVGTFSGMARLPPSANVLFTTVMATSMPFVGRG
jgi:methylglyoxal synthase